MDRLPLVIWIYFADANWTIGKLPKGVYPLVPKRRMWTINKFTGIQARRKGFTLTPDLGSTAHMIQSATLDAAYADFQDASSKVSRVAQKVAYTCLSRVKTMDSIQILQPFSPLLFARGSPIGSERLLRKLSNETSSLEALNEWMQESEENDERETKEADPMKCLHRCTSCYFLGHEDYMHPVKNFGIKLPSHFFSKYIAQGCWTRCLHCQKMQALP